MNILQEPFGLTAIDAFCGPGGMGLGLHEAGFDVRFAFDLDAMAVETHRRNLPGRCEVLDAREISGSFLSSQCGLAVGELDVFAGGPPCQGFSKQKRGAHLGDERNDLVLEFVRITDELRPKVALFENVAIFGQKRGREYLRRMFHRLRDYDLYPGFCNSAHYGLAQTRERFVLVARRRDIAGSFRYPDGSLSKKVTVGNALAGIPEPPDDYTEHPEFPNHQRARVTAINIERFSHVPQGGGWKDIPKKLRLPCHRDVDVSRGGWPDVYGRLAWDGQCPTITGGFDSFTRGRYGHPTSDRPLTPREAARLQGFPDTYVFVGTRADVRSQIGNAVPPPLAKAFGVAIRAALFGSVATSTSIGPLDPANEQPTRQSALF